MSAAPPSSLERLLRVIGLFTPQQPLWTADRIGEVLEVSRATQYRYIKTLMNAGLLAPAGEGRYRLGPRFVVLDRQIRLSDPLSRHGPPVMQRACAELGSAQLLCTHFADEVLCLHQERADPLIGSSMERGRPFPLFLGSPARAILAWLPESRLRNLMQQSAHAIRDAGLGENWLEFRQKLKAIRSQGHCIGLGEIDADLMGIGVPILRPNGEVEGSLTTVLPLRRVSDAELARVIRVTRAAATEISAQLGGSG